MESQDSDIKDILTQFLGQTYSELHKIDKNIIGTSNNLSFKSDEFKRVAAQALNSVDQEKPQGLAAPVGMQRVVAPPMIQHQPQVTQTIVNPDQLEFNFDNSATAKNILEAIQRLDSKFESFERKLLKIIDSRKK